ncbi:aminotransferase-like domain-containing protein [Pseudonocardia sp. TRM90224]|uniref:aminotransferase-like domain-containing protein n=1 Tax=Pseudonocardia sp. TRM90224 TaxID=2812678 RepID=UPI001E437360|nr:PLP-dependent aminotransferase family protein [Pseudonocardia sp. TRM90224]
MTVSLELRDDGEPGDPVYRRIAESIAEGIASGRLGVGDRLPTHRALARQLGVAVPTVSRAYREAEQRGLISSTVGRGTFVSGIPTLRARHDRGAGERPHVDLSVNGSSRGEHEQLLREALVAAAAEPDLGALLSYASDVGEQLHRESAAAWLSRSGVAVAPERVVLCNGGQHALLVAMGALLRPGDVLLTDELTFPGAKSAALVLGAHVVGVEMDGEGMVPAALEAACAGATPPVALYCMPNAHNPTAITLPARRREAIVEIARRYDLQIIEDDVFGLLVPDDERGIPLAALAPERTLLISSLSKTLTPGLRWGAVTGPAQLTDRLGALVRATILNPAPMAAGIADRWLTDGTAARLLTWQHGEMEARFATARRLFGDCSAVRAVRTAGLHAWLDLHETWTPAAVVDVAERLGIAIAPTSFFHADPASATRPGARGVRLCLGNAPDHPTLTAALAALAEALDRGPTWTAGSGV